MDGDVFTDQGGLPIHGIRDVRSTVDGKQHDWSEQAEATETDTLSTDLKSYNRNRHRYGSYKSGMPYYLRNG